MKRIGTCLLMACLATTPFASAFGGERTHPGGKQDRDGKKESAPEAPKAPDAEAFDLAAVIQSLTRISNGVIRRVTASDTSDARQIGLIRANLKKQAEQISLGVVPTPPGTHTAPLASYSTLQAAAPGQLHGQYVEVRAGGEIRYTADDAALVPALQGWLESELSAGSTAPTSIMRRNTPPQ